MNTYIFDIEVFAHDWIVDFRRVDSDRHLTIHNDGSRLRSFFEVHTDDVFGGFNNKHYDDWIVMSMILGATPEIVKEHNDFVIVGHRNAWEFPFVQYKRKVFRSFDLRDDLPKGLSLKAIEGNMYLPIVESSIPFDLDRELTPEELDEVIRYCRNDVDATLELYRRRTEYIGSKLTVAELKGIDPAIALAQTNAKLAAMYLDASHVDRTDERDYRIPENIDQSLIPRQVLDFFNQIHDETIVSDELFETKLEITIAGCECVFAWGGVHGAIPNIIAETDPEGSPDRRIIVNYDVASLYPNSMLNFGYVSRSCESPTAYRDLVQTRITAKKSGNKRVADALKLVINTTYGAMLNQYNDLYDARSGRSVCISNQLAMCELVSHLERDVPSFEILNFNTDGVMFRILEREMSISEPILDEWQIRTKFELERDDVIRIVQKDVNNYIAEEGGGKIKACGDYVKRWRGDDVSSENDIKARLINNDLTIVQIALVEYLIHNTPIEKTVFDCKNPFYFQQIAKFGATYQSAFHDVAGERVPVQKVNRVYATKDTRFGKIYKVKPNGKVEKIASLPDHCVIDNENRIRIDQIDKQFYIDLANERVEQYLQGKKTKRKKVPSMATATKPIGGNVYQKLAKVRREFLESNVKKTGVNKFAEFEYFELSDIVPVATKLFELNGLTFITQFEEELVVGILVNNDNPEDVIRFQVPRTTLDPTKIKGMNALQALGSEITYIRRYLYMLCLDVVECDEIDATIGKDEESSAPEKALKTSPTAPRKASKPVSPEKREEAKAELTNVTGDADKQQINAIIRALKKLRDKDPKYEVFIGETQSKIPTKSNPDRKISKKDADDLLIEIGKKLEE